MKKKKETLSNSPATRYLQVYRVSLVRDGRIAFDQKSLINSAQAHTIIRKLIQTQGQPDREQFCIVMLNAKNVIIGLNIVAMGDLVSATVHPREALKPAILGNACALILAHNHPSCDLTPSSSDLNLTRKMIQACSIMGIHVHEHLIISMDDERYYSFSDSGTIKNMYDEIRRFEF